MQAVSQIEVTHVSRVNIVGVADAMPVGRKLLNEFGNNTGLALSRARCVAGWLTDVLGARNIHLDMTVAARDPADRTVHAWRFGADADRVVQVWNSDPQ
jgi:hypothetical protein